MRSFIKSLINFLYTYLKVHCLIRACSELAAKCIQPDPKRIIFGAMNGKWYGDNSQHLFEWAMEHRPEWKPIWLSKRTSVIQDLKSRGLPAADIRTPRGMLLLFKAQRGVFTNSLSDLALFPFIIPNRLRLIALRHGRSVKKIRFAREGHSISPKEQRERLRESELIEYAISTSEFASDMQEACLKIGREKHIVTGYPRNDELLRLASDPSKCQTQKQYPDLAFKSVILYAPSWRHGRSATRFFPFQDFSVKSLDRILNEKQILLLLRPHVRDLETSSEQAKALQTIAQESNYIKLATHADFPDINSILPEVDALITDYSALYHDYLLLDRPMGFVPYDHDDFKKQNGFFYDYYDYLPGRHIKDNNELECFINGIFDQPDPYSEKRARLRNKIHSVTTDSACQRTADLIDTLSRQNTK